MLTLVSHFDVFGPFLKELTAKAQQLLVISYFPLHATVGIMHVRNSA
jgi:hypothetical protein